MISLDFALTILVEALALIPAKVPGPGRWLRGTVGARLEAFSGCFRRGGPNIRCLRPLLMAPKLACILENRRSQILRVTIPPNA